MPSVVRFQINREAVVRQCLVVPAGVHVRGSSGLIESGDFRLYSDRFAEGGNGGGPGGVEHVQVSLVVRGACCGSARPFSVDDLNLFLLRFSTLHPLSRRGVSDGMLAASPHRGRARGRVVGLRCSRPLGRCWVNGRYALSLVVQKRAVRSNRPFGWLLVFTLGLPRGRLVSYSEEPAFFRLVSKANPHEAFQVERGRQLVRWKCVGVECAHVLKSIIFGLLVG